MATAETVIAIVAFIVSIIALIVTISQLFAQLFETAEGRVKCSKEVMGSWGALTKVKRHWWQLRFETQFFSPEILVSEISDRNEVDFDRLKEGWLKKCSKYRHPRDVFVRKFDFFSLTDNSGEEDDYSSFLLGPKYQLLQSALELPDLEMTDGWQAFVYQLHNNFTSFLDKDDVYQDHGNPVYFGKRNKGSVEEKPGQLSAKPSLRQRFGPLSYLRTIFFSSWHRVSARARLLDDEGLQTLWKRQLELGAKPQTTRNDASGVHNPKPHTQWPLVILRERRWDLFPPDISKPIASTRLYDVAVIAHRMGMVWKQFDPAEASGLQADSGSHILSSLEIRGLGIGVHYRFIRHRQNDPLGRAADDVPGAKVDAFRMLCFCDKANAYLFGIAHGDSDLLQGYTFNVNRTADVTSVWTNVLGFSEERDWDELFKGHGSDWKARRAAHELIHLSAPFFRQMGSGIALLPFHWRGRSLFCLPACRKAFADRLRNEIRSSRSSDHLQMMLDGAVMLAEDLPKDNMSKRRYLDEVQILFIKTIEWFKSRDRSSYMDAELDEDGRPCNHFYFNILRAHLLWSPDHRPIAESKWYKFRRWLSDYRKDSREKHDNETDFERTSREKREKEVEEKEGKKRLRGWEFCKVHMWQGEAVNLMFDSMDKYISFMEQRGFDDPDVVKEAWVTMMIRGFCWALCHQEDRIQGDFLPAQHYGSQMPVYLL